MTGRLEKKSWLLNSKALIAYYIKLIKDKDSLNYSNLIPCNCMVPMIIFMKNSHLLASIIRKVINAKKFINQLRYGEMENLERIFIC